MEVTTARRGICSTYSYPKRTNTTRRSWSRQKVRSMERSIQCPTKIFSRRCGNDASASFPPMAARTCGWMRTCSMVLQVALSPKPGHEFKPLHTKPGCAYDASLDSVSHRPHAEYQARCDRDTALRWLNRLTCGLRDCLIILLGCALDWLIETGRRQYQRRSGRPEPGSGHHPAPWACSMACLICRTSVAAVVSTSLHRTGCPAGTSHLSFTSWASPMGRPPWVRLSWAHMSLPQDVVNLGSMPVLRHPNGRVRPTLALANNGP
jgi:hypothetical protein